MVSFLSLFYSSSSFCFQVLLNINLQNKEKELTRVIFTSQNLEFKDFFFLFLACEFKKLTKGIRKIVITR